MKNKTITRGALWAAAAMAVLICIFVALQLRSDRERRLRRRTAHIWRS